MRKFSGVPAISHADFTTDAHNFGTDTCAALQRRVINANFTRIQLIKPAIFALCYIRHYHIGAALQGPNASHRVQTFHRRCGRNVDIRQQKPHNSHSATCQIKRATGGVFKRCLLMRNKRSDTGHINPDFFQVKQIISD